MQTWKMIKTLTFSPWKKFEVVGTHNYVYIDGDGILMLVIEDMPDTPFTITRKKLNWTWREVA
jgi:hypothetical protein